MDKVEIRKSMRIGSGVYWVVDVCGDYVNKTGVVVVNYCDFATEAAAEAARDLYLEKQKQSALGAACEAAELKAPATMTLDRFAALVDYIVEERIKKVMCAKSKEYAQGQNKLHNFDHAAIMRSITSMEALRGMKLKHEVSIEDMLNGLRDGKTYPRKLWEEKFTDNINYQILQWAILARDNGWHVPGQFAPQQETKPGYGGNIND